MADRAPQPIAFYGEEAADEAVRVLATGRAAIAISRGLPGGPGFAHENEDACGARLGAGGAALVCAADAHFGPEASREVVRALLALDPDDAGDEALRGALDRASDALRQAGAGSECALGAALLEGDRLTWLAVGDVRVTLVDAAGAARELNVLEPLYLGRLRGWPRPQRGEEALGPGARLVLATDGLCECRYGRPTIGPARVGEIARAALGPEDAARALVEAALAGGGEDNVAVAVADGPPAADTMAP